MAQEIKIFLIYDLEDEELQKPLRSHFAALKKLTPLKVNDARTLAGVDKAKKIVELIGDADIILPLVSAQFISSDDCMAQLEQAAKRHGAGAYVFPIILKDCILIPPLTDLDCLPHDPAKDGEINPITSWRDRNAAHLSVAKYLCEVINRIKSGTPVQPPPNQTDINSGQGIKEIIEQVKTQEASPDPRPERLLPYLCDRKPQEKYLETEIRNCFGNDESAANALDLQKPLVFIIHGNDEECVRMYRKRVQEISLRRYLLAGSGSLIRRHYLNLPTEVTDVEMCVEDLKRDLTEKLIKNRYKPLPEVIEDISKLDAPILILSSLSTEVWDRNSPKIIQTFLHFWDSFPPLLPESKLICCLFITHNVGTQESAANKEKARNFLKKMARSKYEGFKLVVMPELEPIDWQEAIKWLYEEINFQDFCEVHQTEFCNTDDAEDYIKGVIYKSLRDRKSMKVLAPELDFLLDKYKCTR